MHYSKILIPFLFQINGAFILIAQQSTMPPRTTLQVSEYQRISIPGFRLCPAEFLPGAQNKLLCPMYSKVFDLVTGEVEPSPKAEEKDWETYAKQRYAINLGADPRWAAVQIRDQTENAPVVYGKYQPRVLVVKGADSLPIPASFWTVSDKAYRADYPYFWMALQTEQNAMTFQQIKCYDAERHAVSEYRFKLPDKSGFGADFIQPVGLDADYIWYCEEEVGLYAFDKRDKQVYAYTLPMPGHWDCIGLDSALIYFYDGLKANLLAVNKTWLEQKRKPFDGSKSLEEALAFKSLQDSFDFQAAADLEQFLQYHQQLHGLYGSSENQTIKTAFEEMPLTLLRRLYGDDAFAKKAYEQFPAFKDQTPKVLLPALCAGLMNYSHLHGDLDAFADFYAILQQTRPGYFLEEGTPLGASCVVKVLQAQKNWQQIREQQQLPPDELLWKKSELVAGLFQADRCNMVREGGKTVYKENHVPVACVYAELARKHPDSKRAAEAVCQVVAWNAAGTKIPLEVWEALQQVSQSDCKMEAETALFWALASIFGDDYRARWLRARDLGRQLLKKYPNLPGKADVESMLESIEADLNRSDGN